WAQTYTRAPSRGAGSARRRRHHLVHLARAGPAGAALAVGARGAGGRACADSRRARPPDHAWPRGGAAAARAATRAAEPDDRAARREPRLERSLHPRATLGLPGVEPSLRGGVRRPGRVA